MLDHPDTEDIRQRLAAIESQRVPLNEVVRWLAPWVLAGMLALVFAGGLWCASSAADEGTYVIGLVAAAFALLALLWELGAALGAGVRGPAAMCLVDDQSSLAVLVAIFVVFAAVGLVLAARSDSAAAVGTGYGLFVFGLAFIFANLKHYFDHREG